MFALSHSFAEPSFQPKPDAGRRGNSIIVSINAAIEERQKKNCLVANEYSNAQVLQCGSKSSYTVREEISLL